MNAARPRALFALLVLFVAAVAPARADNASDRKAIAAMYAAEEKAVRNSDVEALDNILAPDYKIISTSGKVTGREEAIAGSEQLFDAVKTGFVHIEHIQSISLRPDSAIVNVRELSIIPVRTPDGRLHKVRVSATGRDFWVKTDAGWRAKQSRQLTRNTVTVDGYLVRRGGGNSRSRRR
ncbi:MAG: nuclear transport factor 2 family protein [Chloroflexi bacterium]|nr:nuclear transport factor 2 family protein [Chloroflexota bacterium]